MPIVHTSFQPDVPLEVTTNEFRGLLREGLLVNVTPELLALAAADAPVENLDPFAAPIEIPTVEVLTEPEPAPEPAPDEAPRRRR